MKLSSELQGRVLRQIDGSSLARSGFDCRFGAGEGPVVEIEAQAHPHLRFLIRPCADTAAGADWESLESPGPLFRGAETNRFGTLEEAVDYMADWVRRVEEDTAIARGRGAGAESDTGEQE